jgi:WD40 repeat protein
MSLHRHLLLACVCIAAPGASALAQKPVVPPGEKEPLLRLEAGGPTASVTALAFGPDGNTLYAAGWDKVVRVWRANAAGQFVPEPPGYRVPIGPGLAGVINAVALSEDGTWLAVGGVGTARGLAGFRQDGVVGVLSAEMRRDQGTIYLFNTHTGEVRLLQGHGGTVTALRFAPPAPGHPLLLVSAANEWDFKEGRFTGGLRLWDVGRGETLAELRRRLDPKWLESYLPSLAVWRTGPGAAEVRVAVAYGDQRLREWDAARDGLAVQERPDAVFSVALAAPRGELLVGSFRQPDGRLQARPVGNGKAPMPTAVATFPRSPAGLQWQPRAVAPFAGRGDGQADGVAVVLMAPTGSGPEHTYRLQLVRRDGPAPGLAPAVTLWQSGPRQPILATAPRGRFLAVAGNDRHEIQIYRIDELLAGRARPQTRRAAGESFTQVAFARKGPDVGLALGRDRPKEPGAPPGGPVTGDLVLDFARHSLTADTAGWQPDVVPPAGYRAEAARLVQPEAVNIFKDDRRVLSIPLPDKRDRLSDFALLPTRPPWGVPLLAVAFHRAGEPALLLYNAATGELVRQYTGHVERIHALAFAADGRLLVSTAADRTVCVWSLTDLDRTLGRKGGLPWLRLKREPNKVVVGAVKNGSPLREGDVLEAILEKEVPRPLTSQKDLFAALEQTRPGQTLRVQVQGSPRPIDLRVSQAADERKPLLSVFVAAGTRDGTWDWVGWHPAGPYESSGVEAERHLGWHFNTGNAEAPTRFALADQYRKTYYRADLVKDLLAAGSLQALPPAAPPPPPMMTLWIEEEGRNPERDAHDHVPVRSAAVTLRFAVLRRPLNTLRALTWQLDDGPEQALALDGAVPELAVPLRLERGVHRVRVAASPREAPDRKYTADLSVRYQPPPPAVKHAKAAPPLSVDRPEFTLAAVVTPGLPGQSATLTIRHIHGQKEVAKESFNHTFTRSEPLPLTRPFQLQPGRNLLEIVAVNQGALAGFEDAETGRLAVEVVYFERAKPPTIALLDVVLEDGSKLPIDPGQVVRVEVPKVRVRGRIEAAAEELAEASWSRELDAARGPLTGFTPGAKKELLIDETLELRTPGTQVFRFRARTATSPEAEAAVRILYRPLLPAVALLEPEPGRLVVGQGKTQAIEVRARLTPPGHAHPYQAFVLVNGQEYRANVNEANRLLTASVPLRPKDNRIQIRLRNAWGAEFTSAAVPVTYHRPPLVLGLGGPPRTDQPTAEFVAQVRSDLEVRVDGVRVEVNGRARPARAAVAAVPGQDGVWEVRLREVGLDAGAREGEEKANDVRVWVRNEEGECREPGSLRVAFRPVQQPPDVRFLQPAPDSTVHKARVAVRFRVASPSPLTRVQLVRPGSLSLAVDVSNLPRDSGGRFVVEREETVDLDPGVNTLRLEAANGGGEQSALLTLSYPYRPVRVEIQKVVPLDEDRRPVAGTEMPVELQEGGRVVFPKPAARGLVRLHGNVLWDEADDERLQQASQVRVYVNGFQQAPAELRRPAGQGRVRPFAADLLLTQAADNRVEIALPGLAQDAASRTRFAIQCRKPERAQHIHLILLSAREAGMAGLRQQVRKAFQLDEHLNGVLPDGGEVHCLKGLTGADVASDKVLGILTKLQRDIRRLSVTYPTESHVVMFWYQGQETVDVQGNLFENQLRCDDLTGILGDILGAQIMLLDVTRPDAGPLAEATDRVRRWESHYPEARHHTAVLRYAGPGPARGPRDARLLTVLEQALPRAPRLADVAVLVENLRKEVPPDLRKLLAYDEYIAEELKDVRLGRGP